LTEKWNENRNGFLTNWDMIPVAYAEKRLSLLTDNGIAIGFAVYHIFNELANIYIYIC